VRFPGESADYRAARDLLLRQEVELRRAMESVAAARRALPPGGPVTQDYVFQGAGARGEPAEVRLSELFTPGHDTLAIYHYMFPRDPDDDRPGPASGESASLPLGAGPCPSCTALLDQLDGAVEHVSPHVDFAVVAKAPLPRLLTFAAERGWRRLRLLSCADTTFGSDYHAETPEGRPSPMLNVFRRDDDGGIRHFWGSELYYEPTEPGQDPRQVGTIEPVWNIFDLTPHGRGTDWDEQLAYEDMRVVSVGREISAPAAQIFELIADPSQQPRWDGNDNLAQAQPGQRVRAVGDVFAMTLTKNGAIRENHVVEFDEGHRIAWRPAEPGRTPPGHLWRWELEQIDSTSTRVTHTYDWTELTDEGRYRRAKATTPEKLRASLDRLAALAER
jgi:predicted dithiol-disulfide oxidoreductase (DUF899 family)